MLTGGKDSTLGIPEDTDALFISASPVAVTIKVLKITLIEPKNVGLKATPAFAFENKEISTFARDKSTETHNVAHVSREDGKASLVLAAKEGGIVVSARKVRPGNGPGPKPVNESINDESPVLSLGLSATESVDGVESLNDASYHDSGIAIDDVKTIANGKETESLVSSEKRIVLSEKAPLIKVEAFETEADALSHSERNILLFVTKIVKFIAPTFAPLGINREADMVRVPEKVGVNAETSTAKNSLLNDTEEITDETEKSTVKL